MTEKELITELKRQIRTEIIISLKEALSFYRYLKRKELDEGIITQTQHDLIIEMTDEFYERMGKEFYKWLGEKEE